MRVALGLQGDDLDDDLRAAFASDVRDLLLSVDGVDDVRFATGNEVPSGAKAGEVFQWGSLLVSFASAASFRVLVDALASWLHRQPQDLTIEIDGAKLSGQVSAKERQDLVNVFTSRISGNGGASAR
jgi:hypothetical protein